MFSVSVRHTALVAYSLKGTQFGSAQQLHGATLIVDAEFFNERLKDDNTVIDILLASQILQDVLSNLNYRNLDEMEAFAKVNTTIEYLASYVHYEIMKRVRHNFSGQLKVTIHETDRAWASYMKAAD
jgi:6-pyruvoyl-tetrahydropterin synthase